MRDKSIKIRLTQNERSLLDQRSGNLSVAEYIRQCSLHKPPVHIPPANASAIKELNKIGVNLNQLVHHANYKADEKKLADILRQVWVETMLLSGVIGDIEAERNGITVHRN